MDQLVACGVQKGIIDTSRIHVAGYSAGGLETGAAIFSRSNCVASGIVYSGGKPFGAGNLPDPANASKRTVFSARTRCVTAGNTRRSAALRLPRNCPKTLE
jgi:poly(3-hydroxybutyrate) depolymerase